MAGMAWSEKAGIGARRKANRAAGGGKPGGKFFRLKEFRLCLACRPAMKGVKVLAAGWRPAAGGLVSLHYRHDETFLGAVDSGRSADFALILAGVGLDAFSVFPAGETEARIVAILVRSGECFFDAFEGDGWVNLSSRHGSPPSPSRGGAPRRRAGCKLRVLVYVYEAAGVKLVS